MRSNVGPIIFGDETARQQILDEGEVVSFRTSRRTTGETWWRETRTGPKQGDVRVDLIGPANATDPDDLREHRPASGFESVEGWQAAIERLNGSLGEEFLYRATEDTDS